MSLLQQRLLTRIANSPHRMVLVFPAAKAAVTSTPVNPFGPTPTTVAVPAATTPIKPPVTIACLWADGAKPGDLAAPSEQVMRREVGWYAEATSVARVLLSDVAVVAGNPWGPTLFDQVHHIEFGGKQYEVVQVTPVSAGHLVPVSYAVWLKAATQQAK